MFKKFIVYFSFFSLSFFIIANADSNQLISFVQKNLSDIRIGKSSALTRQLEVDLNALGYTVADDGPGSPGSESKMFDENLKNALKDLQKKSKIPVTGKFDIKTMQVVNVYIEKYNKDLEDDALVPTEDSSQKYSSDEDMDKDYFSDNKDNGIYFSGDKKESTDYYGGTSFFNQPDTKNQKSADTINTRGISDLFEKTLKYLKK